MINVLMYNNFRMIYWFMQGNFSAANTHVINVTMVDGVTVL